MHDTVNNQIGIILTDRDRRTTRFYVHRKNYSDRDDVTFVFAKQTSGEQDL